MLVHVTLKDRRLLVFIYGKHTAAVAIAVAATTPTKLAVTLFTPPDVFSVVTVPLEPVEPDVVPLEA